MTDFEVNKVKDGYEVVETVTIPCDKEKLEGFKDSLVKRIKSAKEQRAGLSDENLERQKKELEEQKNGLDKTFADMRKQLDFAEVELLRKLQKINKTLGLDPSDGLDTGEKK